MLKNTEFERKATKYFYVYHIIILTFNFDAVLPRREPRRSSEESRPEYSSLFHIFDNCLEIEKKVIF